MPTFRFSNSPFLGSDMDTRVLSFVVAGSIGLWAGLGCDGGGPPLSASEDDSGVRPLPVLRGEAPSPGEPPNAALDAGVVPQPDASSVHDAGSVNDADGGTAGGGDVHDAGAIHDAGATTDGGPDGHADAGDGSLHDAGETLDGGAMMAADAGALVDAGAQEADGGPNLEFVAGQGDRCYLAGGTGCADGLVCADIYEPGIGICEYPCMEKGSPCSTGGICTDLGFLGSPQQVCANPVGEGDACETESLRLCTDGSECILNSAEPLGGTCRMPCACSDGATCDAERCGEDVCVVLNQSSGAGFCGTPVPPGERCSPIDEALLCVGTSATDATCVLSVGELESGSCQLRCASESDCVGAPGTGCMGAPDGLCMTLSGLGQGELCTLAGAAAPHTLTCADGLDCVGVHEAYAPDFGVCLQSCTNSASCDPGAACYELEGRPDVGRRCFRELPRGATGCNPPEPLCAGENGLCVMRSSGEGTCKLKCTLAKCPGADCECSAPESCIDDFVASDTLGVCGSRAGWREPCDIALDVYCAPAPGQEIETNAMAMCVGTCDYFCRMADNDGTLIDLTCPDGFRCREDPSGRWLPPTRICVPDAAP